MDCYKGYRGALLYIADLAFGYDGYNSVDTLKDLIDELRQEAITALEMGEDYDALRDAIKG